MKFVALADLALRRVLDLNQGVIVEVNS
jgi:hypothetical protein